ncbi:MAG: hypothetical protein HYX84_07540 [Chloroflexi bacterium]|nr:hypothetical protein [Chloroflexota bacterium]
MESEQQEIKLGGELIFAALPGNLHGKGKSLAAKDAVQDRQGYLLLVRTKLTDLRINKCLRRKVSIAESQVTNAVEKGA